MLRLLAYFWFASLAFAASAPGVQAVYMLPMTSGLDQYLANRLSSAGVYRVVTDPKLADAIFTDRLGSAFEQKLADLFPPPKPEGEKDDKDSGRPPKHVYTGGGAKNTIFLVDLKSRVVIWSAYEKPGRVTPATLDREAIRIVREIQKQQKEK
jgi:hypothetical protein